MSRSRTSVPRTSVPANFDAGPANRETGRIMWRGHHLSGGSSVPGRYRVSAIDHRSPGIPARHRPRQHRPSRHRPNSNHPPSKRISMPSRWNGDLAGGRRWWL